MSTARRPVPRLGGLISSAALLLALGACSFDDQRATSATTTAPRAETGVVTPAGATTTTPASTVDLETADLPLLLPRYLPGNASIVQASYDDSTLAQFGSSIVISGPGNALLVVDTEPGDGSPQLPIAEGTDVKVGDHPGRYFSDLHDNGQSLAWIDGDHLISLGTHSAVPEADLLALADHVTVGDDNLLDFAAFGEYRGSLAPGTTKSWALTATGDDATINLSVESGDENSVEALSTFEAADHAGVHIADVDIAGQPAHLITYDDSPSKTLLWHGFGALVMINSDLDEAELVKVADGLEQVDDTTWHARLDPYLTVQVTGSGTWNGITWKSDLGFDAQGWCGDLSSADRTGAACDDSGAERTADAVWFIDPPHHGVDEAVDLDIFGVTRLPGAARVELRGPDAAVLGSADVVPADLEPYRVFAMWPNDDLDPETAEDGGYTTVLLDADGNVLSTHTLAETDVVALGASDEQWSDAEVLASGPGWELKAVDTIVPAGALGLTPVDPATDVTTGTTPISADDEVESICVAGPGVVNGSCIPMSAWSGSEPYLAYTWGEEFQSVAVAVVSVLAGTTSATAVTDGGLTVTAQIVQLPTSLGPDLWVAVFPMGPDHGLASVTIGTVTSNFPGHAAPFFESENPCGSSGQLYPVTSDEFITVTDCGVIDTAP